MYTGHQPNDKRDEESLRDLPTAIINLISVSRVSECSSRAYRRPSIPDIPNLDNETSAVRAQQSFLGTS